MLNVRDGVGGVKLTREECETELKLELGLQCYEPAS